MYSIKYPLQRASECFTSDGGLIFLYDSGPADFTAHSSVLTEH